MERYDEVKAMQLTVARIGLAESSDGGMTIILCMKIENVRDES